MHANDGVVQDRRRPSAAQQTAATTPRACEPPTATGLPPQGRVVALFDGRIKGIHVNVNDVPLRPRL
jgi:hypothetical protein